MSSLSSLQTGPETLSLWGSVAAVQRWLRLRTSSKLVVIAGILYALSSGRPGLPIAIMGYLIFGALGLYTLAIFIRIIFSWGAASYSNRWMRFVIRITEPLLGPLRSRIKPVGMFDISPIIAFLIVWLCQLAVASTLLRGWPVRFF